MIDNIIGLSLQTFIWISLGYVYLDFNTKNIYLFPYNIIVYALAISVFVYFFEFLFRSKLYSILTKYRKYTKSIQSMINIVSKAKLSLEVYTKAFHYKNNKEILTKNEIITLNFTDVEDLSKISEIESFYVSQNAKTKLIIMDIDLSIEYDEKSNYLLLEKRINDIKTELSLKDKYYEVQTGYTLEDLSKKENIFIIENSRNSFLFNPYFLILSYLLLIGEFYRIVIEMNLLYCLITLNKSIKGIDISKKDRIEKLFNNSNDSFLNDDDKDMIVFDTKEEIINNPDSYKLMNKTNLENNNLGSFNSHNIKSKEKNTFLDINIDNSDNVKDSTVYNTTKSKEEEKYYLNTNYDIKQNTYKNNNNERRSIEKKIKSVSKEKLENKLGNTSEILQQNLKQKSLNDKMGNNSELSNSNANQYLITNHNPLFEVEQIKKQHLDNSLTESDNNVNFEANKNANLIIHNKVQSKDNQKSNKIYSETKKPNLSKISNEDLQIEDDNYQKIPHGKNFSLSSENFDGTFNPTDNSNYSNDNLEIKKNISNNYIRDNNRFKTDKNIYSKSTNVFPSTNKSRQNITTSNESDEDDVDYSEELNENIFDIFENSNQVNLKALEQRKSKKSITQIDKIKEKQKYKDKMKKIFAKGAFVNTYSSSINSNINK